MKPQRQARPPAVVPWFICRAHASEFLSLVRGELRHLPRRPVVVLRFPAVRMRCVCGRASNCSQPRRSCTNSSELAAATP